MRKAFLFQNPNLNQSGAKESWVIKFSDDNYSTNIMLWSGTKNPLSNFAINFDNKESAILFAKENNYELEELLISNKHTNIKPKNYSNNFQ